MSRLSSEKHERVGKAILATLACLPVVLPLLAGTTPASEPRHPTRVTSVSSQIAPRIAVQAGLAGNIDPIASFANILALLMARRAGLSIRRTILLQFLVGVAAFLPALL